MSPQDVSTIKVGRPLRHTPIQERSQGTVRKIKIAAHKLLSDPNVGRDVFNTTMVAELAGVSIGSVYRYFPDRVAILKAIWADRSDTFIPPFVEGMYDDKESEEEVG